MTFGTGEVMSGLRVLQVVTDTTRRGAQVFGVDLHDDLVRRGHVVHTVALADEGADDPLPIPALGRRRLVLRTLYLLRRQLRGADVVVAHGSSTLPACALATIGTRRPFIYRSIGDIGYWTGDPMRRARTRWALRRAAAVVALWPGAAAGLTRRFGVERARVHVVPNAVPGTSWPPVGPDERRAARRSFHLDEDVPTVVYVGALAAEKDVGVAITAVGALPSVHLLVVGDGPLGPDLEELAGRVAGDRVSFIGRTDPRPAVAAADAIVLPSRSEGLPGVLIEAGLAGLPAIATDVGGVGEIVVPQVTGALVPPSDPDAFARAITQVLAERATLGPAARAHCLRRFELAVVGETWAQLLGTVVR